MSLLNPMFYLVILFFAFPDIKEKPKWVISDDKNTLSIMTLNTWGLPVPYGKSSNASRHDKLVEAIKLNGSDIICLQEVFNHSLRKKLSDKISNTLHYTDMRCERKVYKLINMDCYGGLVTLSKYPITHQEFFPFPIKNSYSLIETVGKKGFLLTTIQIDTQRINVINTHLYAGDSQFAEKCRVEQIHYMDSIISVHPDWNEIPLFIAGDLNIQHPQVSFKNKEITSPAYQSISKSHWTDVRIPQPEIEYTYDPASNPYANKKEKRQILDYIFLKSECQKIICKRQFVMYTKEQSVSDHNGYIAQFDINKPTQKNYKLKSDLAIISEKQKIH